MAFLVNPYQVQAVVSEEFSNTYSIDFDGVNDYVDLGTGLNSSLELGDSFSYSAWIKFSAGSTNRTIISSLQASGPKGTQLRVLSTEAIRIIFVQSGAVYKYVDSSVLAVDTWHHVVATYDGSNTIGGINLYINGSLNNNSTGTSGTLTSITSVESLKIGKYSTSSNMYSGKIDEVGIWDVELDSDAVSALYNSGSPISLSSDSGDYDNSSDLIGWWRMGDGANYPIVKNQAHFSQTVVDFDGADDYVDLGDSNTFSFGDGSTDSAFSGSMWVYRDNASNHSLLSKMATSNREWNFYVYSNKLTLALFDESANAYIGRRYNSALISGAWSHIAFTYNGNGTTGGIKLYLNGSQVDDTNLSSGSYSAMENLTESAKIGHDPVNSLYIDGMIDDVLITSTELSSSDITDIYNSGYPKDESERSGLVGYWKMGDGDTYPTLTDNSTNSNDGTMTNMASGDFVAAKDAGTMTNMASDDIVEDTP